MASIEDKNLKIDENLKANDVLIESSLEKRIAHMSEKADLVIGYDGDDVRAVYESVFSERAKRLGVIRENEKYVSAVKKAIDMYDKINCVENYCSENRLKSFDSESEVIFEADTVVYLKNPLADIAYSRFSKLLKDARVSYEDSFANVCEEVYYNRAPYCILPLENSDDGRLSGFGNMIRKYELKIVLTCNVESSNGKITKFALLKRELARMDCPANLVDGRYLEIGFNFGDEQKLHEILQAAHFFGYKLNKVDSLPIYYSEKEYYFDVVFKGDGSLEKFLIWLELEMPRYEIIGVYTQIKTLRSKNGG